MRTKLLTAITVALLALPLASAAQATPHHKCDDGKSVQHKCDKE